MDKHIGAQLFTLREFCKTAEDLDATCKKLRDIGYSILQVSAVGPIPAAKIREIADYYDMKIVCTHRSFDDFLSDLDEIIAYNQALGCALAGVGMMPNRYLKDYDSVMEFVQQSNACAKRLKENGLYFGYHNHAIEFVKYNGKFLYDYLIEETDPDAYRFIADTYWMAFSGIDPARQIKQLGERAMAVHFKDLMAKPDNSVTMCEVLEGNLDWDSIIAACEDAGSRWALVEQDVCERNPFDSMAISYQNLKAKGFC